ncbi:MAG TPA: hypothetical protein VNT53_03850 [Pseudolysinimonas sp.]|nr:hypothetical protein [Pseudolysinimonas sp.]
MPSADARRRRVIDIRLVIGLALVAVSVAGVVGLVGAVDRRIAVYAAAEGLEPGDRVRVSDLVVRRVALDGAEKMYLAEGAVPSSGLVLTAVVRKGELVPRAALSTETGQVTTAIVLTVSTPPSEAAVPGSLVDVWAAPSSTSGSPDPATEDSDDFASPVILVSDAVVVRVLDEAGLVSSGTASQIEVRVPRSRVARVLEAIAADDALAVVPAGLTIGEL